MERLIEKMGNYYCSKERNEFAYYEKIIYKLGQLEDIEEELGIELSVLFKAQTSLELFFIDLEKTNYGYIFSMPTSDCSFNLSNKTLHICGDVEDYELKDYGKTWALTKEELEK